MLHHTKKMNNIAFMRINSQRGWTMWSMLFVGSVVFFVAYIIMQLVPLYSGNASIENAMRISIEDKDLTTFSKAKVLSGMQRQFFLDDPGVDLNLKKDVKVSRSKDIFLVEASYSRDIPLFLNMSLVVQFNPKVECQLNGRCDR